MSADGGPVTKLTSEPNKADRPTWALDFIAYSAEVPGSKLHEQSGEVRGRVGHAQPAVLERRRHAVDRSAIGQPEPDRVRGTDGRRPAHRVLRTPAHAGSVPSER